MGVGDDREPERAGHALAVGLAIGREREHRFDQPLELQRRPDLAREAGLGVADVPEAVRRSRLYRILQKLRLRDRVQAVVLAYETGLIEPGSS
jgi:hypothetical protein